MYSIAEYGMMISDTVRMGAYGRALQQAITPDSVVIDIGTGTGIFALLACRFGARRVYAIEPDDAIQVAREIARANGYADRIEFVQARSTDVTLPEQGDVIVSDLGSALPWFAHHLPSIIDARTRLLAPGGELIPRRDVGWMTIVSVPDLYARRISSWDRCCDLDMQPARKIVVNSLLSASVTCDHLLTPLQEWASIDYATVTEADAGAQVMCAVLRADTGHGVALGFHRTLSDGIVLSNAPDTADDIRAQIYGTLFLPWPNPVALEVGDVVTVALAAKLIGDGYIWTWKTRVSSPGRSATTKAEFAQSTFYGAPLSPASLRKRAASYMPALNEDGRIARSVLRWMDSGATLDAIATQTSREFPSRFRSHIDALSHVAELARLYS